jgi:hypothetical protein
MSAHDKDPLLERKKSAKRNTGIGACHRSHVQAPWLLTRTEVFDTVGCLSLRAPDAFSRTGALPSSAHGDAGSDEKPDKDAKRASETSEIKKRRVFNDLAGIGRSSEK